MGRFTTDLSGFNVSIVWECWWIRSKMLMLDMKSIIGLRTKPSKKKFFFFWLIPLWLFIEWYSSQFVSNPKRMHKELLRKKNGNESNPFDFYFRYASIAFDLMFRCIERKQSIFFLVLFHSLSFSHRVPPEFKRLDP